jgi:hypothetical protein
MSAPAACPWCELGPTSKRTQARGTWRGWVERVPQPTHEMPTFTQDDVRKLLKAAGGQA